MIAVITSPNFAYPTLDINKSSTSVPLGENKVISLTHNEDETYLITLPYENESAKNLVRINHKGNILYNFTLFTQDNTTAEPHILAVTSAGIYIDASNGRTITIETQNRTILTLFNHNGVFKKNITLPYQPHLLPHSIETRVFTDMFIYNDQIYIDYRILNPITGIQMMFLYFYDEQSGDIELIEKIEPDQNDKLKVQVQTTNDGIFALVSRHTGTENDLTVYEIDSREFAVRAEFSIVESEANFFSFLNRGAMKNYYLINPDKIFKIEMDNPRGTIVMNVTELNRQASSIWDTGVAHLPEYEYTNIQNQLIIYGSGLESAYYVDQKPILAGFTTNLNNVVRLDYEIEYNKDLFTYEITYIGQTERTLFQVISSQLEAGTPPQFNLIITTNGISAGFLIDGVNPLFQFNMLTALLASGYLGYVTFAKYRTEEPDDLEYPTIKQKKS